MKRVNGRYVSGGVLLAALAGGLVFLQAPAPVAGQGNGGNGGGGGGTTKSLGDLLKDTGLAFTQLKTDAGRPPAYKVFFEFGGATFPLFVEEKTWDWKYKDGSKVKVAYVYTFLKSLGKEAKPSAPLLRKLLALNDNIPIGNISLSPDNTIIFNVGFQLRGCDAEQLVMYFASLGVDRATALKELQPYFAKE